MPTKKHRLSPLPLLVLFLPFLMGNAPAPFPLPEEYGDIEVQTITLADDEEGYHRYEITIHNVGESYARADDSITYNKQHLYNDSGSYIEGRLFANELISPGQTKTYVWKTHDNVEFQPDDVWTAYT